ncbi:hypothetical protein FHR81_004751 [Actinoalloteichus hoggarensis]|uniref:Uncharacterized protein n=1 Tax=Actinoalloteichus hoggarensis TaxID=1470176 RepID=A0A221W4X0_9PSEU|nr:hypothetical protein [Actinoalloteichus hoggarensis]ASO20639.1 hypothetical protein AHOG_14990 [Actinoalloteichus hoggarensis]MBB5923680.1 hypothetical protein [Actinoalloteichus hoggarensis]
MRIPDHHREGFSAVLSTARPASFALRAARTRSVTIAAIEAWTVSRFDSVVPEISRRR